MKKTISLFTVALIFSFNINAQNIPLRFILKSVNLDLTSFAYEIINNYNFTSNKEENYFLNSYNGKSNINVIFYEDYNAVGFPFLVPFKSRHSFI